jgi:hypothetical protein
LGRGCGATLPPLALLAQSVEHLHGKEGVDGSSPSEGSAKAPEIGLFAFGLSCTSSTVQWVWSRLWSFQAQNALLRAMLAGPGAPSKPRDRVAEDP